MTPASGTCPICGSNVPPLTADPERFGYVAFHRRCEPYMVARQIKINAFVGPKYFGIVLGVSGVQPWMEIRRGCYN